MADLQDWTTRALIREAGESLPHMTGAGEREVSAYVIQRWSTVNRCWMDGPSEQYDTEAEALERATEMSEWDHIERLRIIHRTVKITERLITGDIDV